MVAELLRSTAGDDDVEEVDEMLSFSGFRGLLNENLLTKRSGLGFGDKTGGLLPDLLVVSVEPEDLTLSMSLFEGADELFDLTDLLPGECRELVPLSFFFQFLMESSIESELFEPLALKGLLSLGRCRLEVGVGVVSGSRLSDGVLGFSNLVAKLFRSTAGNNNVEEVDEMLSFFGF